MSALLAAAASTAIMVAGQPVDIGRPVVLWNDANGFDGYAEMCVESQYASTSKCCTSAFRRYGDRKGLKGRTLPELQKVVSQLVLHLDGCVNSRSCFYSMHDTPRPDGGCGLSAHFMVDADGTIYQTLDLLERAWHAEEVNSMSVGIEICNRGDASRNELDRLPKDYRSRPVKVVEINGHQFHAFDFRPEQYESVIALARALTRIFPQMEVKIPTNPDGSVRLTTLEDPLDFHGIVGHLHVDLQRHRWDPGAFNWSRLMNALTDYHFPVAVANYRDVPRDAAGLDGAGRALFRNVEEAASAHYPMAPLRLWHSGVHLRGVVGESVVAPAPGRIVAARLPGGGRDAGMVLIRHEVDVERGQHMVFYSLLAHLGAIPVGATSPIRWMHAVATSPGAASMLAGLRRGELALIDVPVESGEQIGVIGTVHRGPEHGPEVHFEIFSEDRPPGELGKQFLYVDAANDGPIVRRGALVQMMDTNEDTQVDTDEMNAFFHSDDALERRQALRRLAIRHVHEWGDILSESRYATAPELDRIAPDQRRILYRTAMLPYLFWSNAVARHAGLPLNQTVYSYNPIAFMLGLAAVRGDVRAPLAIGDFPNDEDLGAAPIAHVPVTEWTKPPLTTDLDQPILGPVVDADVAVRRRDEIPLILPDKP